MDDKKTNYLRGAAVLAIASIISKIGSAVYKIPIFNIIGDDGAGYFHVTYSVYTLILTICTAGVPVALSRQVSQAAALGKPRLVKRYFAVALPAFFVLGSALCAVMFFSAGNFAEFMNNSLAASGIRVLAPAVIFACFIAVYRGYAQGFENMTPTAISQVVEVVSKVVFGLVIAKLLKDAGCASHIVSAGAIMGVTLGLGLSIPLLALAKRKLDKTRLSIQKPKNEILPGRLTVLKQIFAVSIPITIGATFMNVLTLIDSKVVLARLQTGLSLTERAASAELGVYSKGLSIFNVPPALIVPISVSIIPAIAASIASKRSLETQGIIASALKIVNLLAMPAGAGITILARPIYTVLYGHTDGPGPQILAILGIAAFFVCLQLVSTAVLQADGHERITMLTFPIGGAVQIALDYLLVGNPKFGIVGSPIGTLTCYAVISALNFIFIIRLVKDRPKLLKVFLKPLICTVLMAVAARSVYDLSERMLGGISRGAMTLYLSGSVFAAMLVYFILIIATRTITREDMKLIPKGDRLADILKIR